MDTIIDRRKILHLQMCSEVDWHVYLYTSEVNYLFSHKRGNFLSEVLKGLRPGTGGGKIADYEMDILACRA